MQRFAFQIQYSGKNYFGWQRQIGQISVQEKIEEKLHLLYNQTNIGIIGCGRTDTGVHANDYFFHVDLPNKYEENVLKYKLNKMFPNDISIVQIKVVGDDFHARFDAKKRTYRYFIHQLKNPFINDFSWFFVSELNILEMNKASELLLGKQDFTSLSKLHTDAKTNICTVYEAHWIQENENKLYFEISADRFLRNMVRASVGTLIDVGLGKINPNEIKTILEAKNRSMAKNSVPPHGLFLWEVLY
jgi:tRNA pseudouridine38-40 synthase